MAAVVAAGADGLEPFLREFPRDAEGRWDIPNDFYIQVAPRRPLPWEAGGEGGGALLPSSTLYFKNMMDMRILAGRTCISIDCEKKLWGVL